MKIIFHIVWIGMAFACTGCNQGAGWAESGDGTRISYSRSGSGDMTLVFVHGWCCNKEFWKHQVPCFEDSYSIVVLDLAGFGTSETRDNHSFDAWGKDIMAVVGEVNPGKYVLIGHSSGGYAVLNAATKADERLAAIVGIDSYRGRIGTQISDETAVDAWEEVMDLGPAEYDQWIRDSDRWFVPESDTAEIRWIKDEMADCLKESAAQGIMEYYRYMSRAPEDFIKLDCQVFGINQSGSRFDSLFFSGSGIRFTPYYLDHVGHFVMMDDPETFNLLLEGIVKSIR